MCCLTCCLQLRRVRDNLLVVKVFATAANAARLKAKEMRKRRKRKLEPVPWYIVLPSYRWKMLWDLFIMLFVFTSAFSIPTDIVYREIFEDSAFNRLLDGLDWSMLVLFLVDFTICWVTSSQGPDGVWLDNVPSIAIKYTRTWFVIDLLAIIPFQHMAGASAGSLGLLKVLRLFRLGKLLKAKNALLTSRRAVVFRERSRYL